MSGRYSYLIFDGKMQNLPKVTISNRSTDKFFPYDSNQTRLDRMSGIAYSNDTYGWLILMANPEYSMEFDIPKNTTIRVPFPLKEAESEYISKILNSKDRQ